MLDRPANWWDVKLSRTATFACYAYAAPIMILRIRRYGEP